MNEKKIQDARCKFEDISLIIDKVQALSFTVWDSLANGGFASDVDEYELVLRILEEETRLLRQDFKEAFTMLYEASRESGVCKG